MIELYIYIDIRGPLRFPPPFATRQYYLRLISQRNMEPATSIRNFDWAQELAKQRLMGADRKENNDVGIVSLPKSSIH
jgi:hypothetical protein